MKWERGTCGFRYKKATVLKTRLFDISVLKILDGGHINRHYDEKRQLRLNIELPFKGKGGKFDCPDAYFNCCGIALYRADKHKHMFKFVSFETKYVISLGFYY